MNKNKWSRQDVVNWMRMINECGCEEEEHSIHGDTMYKAGFEPYALRNQVQMHEGAAHALCPDTYSKVADAVCENPHAILESLKPIMREIGVGCPQSFAKAIADVFLAGQDMGIIKPFNTEM
tara:strand:+ start:3731 stop:4096 length:366 start_codon:yes stop_codon:yes gene_type:complete